MILKKFVREFEEHLPFAMFATFLAFLLVIVLNTFGISLERGMFEGVHFTHLFFSAAATSAVFYRYRKNLIGGIFVGIIGAILIGSISDVLFPYLGAQVFRIPISFHLPLLEETLFVLGVSLIGAGFGIFIKKSFFSHSAHVFLSVFASLFYIRNYASLIGVFDWVFALLIVVLTVWLPCCLSDLGFPLLFVGKKHKHS